MVKLIQLEWRKLEQKKIVGEVIVYWLIILFLPTILLKFVFADMLDFGSSYEAAMKLMVPIQMGNLLLGASLINHVFIEEYKNKTISLSFGYPFSRKQLTAAKILFILITVFISSSISFVLAGIATYGFDQIYHIIDGSPTLTDFVSYAVRTIIYSVVIALASLVPLFYFGIYKRAVIPTVICAVFLMQFPNFIHFFGITPNLDLIYIILSFIGLLNIILSVKLINQVGDL